MSRLKCWWASNMGNFRDENQDQVRAVEYGSRILAAVCDGMGGERCGSKASEIAVRELLDRFEAGVRPEMTPDEIRALLISSVSAANSVVYTTSRMDYRSHGMGTTAVAALVEQEWISLVNVGDSRAYMIEDGRIRLLTSDHTVVNALIREGKITRAEAATHPQRNMLTRAVGVERVVKPDYYRFSRREGTILLLCSDGLSGYCTAEEILQTVQAQEQHEAIPQALVNLALSKGGRDNISLAIITNINEEVR